MSEPLDLEAAERLIANCRTYNFGMRAADDLAHIMAPALVAEVKRLRAVTSPTREELIRVLAENGLDGDGNNPHSWRCSDKGRYPGDCECPGEIADDILALLPQPAPEPGNVPTCDECGAPATYRLGMPTPAWCESHGPKPGTQPAPETDWEYGEFSPHELENDGSLNRWAEPVDTWEDDLPAEELAELRAEGSIYARRRPAGPWLPVPETKEQ